MLTATGRRVVLLSGLKIFQRLLKIEDILTEIYSNCVAKYYQGLNNRCKMYLEAAYSALFTFSSLLRLRWVVVLNHAIEYFRLLGL